MGVTLKIGRLSRGLFVPFLAAVAMAVLPAVASASSDFNSTSCTSSEFCMVVGSSGAAGSTQIAIEKWNGSIWARSSYSNPSGAVESRLSAVSCRSTTSCMAVGSYVDSGKATHPLALTWNGTSWTQTATSPQPGGSTGGELNGVSCPTGTSGCGAAGSYTDAGGKRHALSPWWSGTSWSELSLPIPAGATSSEVMGGMCTTVTSCHLVGSYVDASGTTKPLALKLNTETWVLKSTPLPAGAASGRLNEASCVSSACVAVGSYVDGSGVKKTYALKYASEAWSLTTVPVPSEATASELTGVSCPSASECTAVGSFDRNSETRPLALKWDGTVWSEQTVESESLAASTAPFAGVSCPSTTMCQAVGSLTYGKTAAHRAFAFSLNAGKWAPSGADGYQREWGVVELPPPASGPEASMRADVACPSPSFCVRVGSSTTGSTSTGKAREAGTGSLGRR